MASMNLTIIAAVCLGLMVKVSTAGCADSASKSASPSVTYRTVETSNYIVQVPEGWKVGEETPFGQREILPGVTVKSNGESMSSMTGPGLGKQTWKQLYETSLYYITRYSPHGVKMKATPYILGSTKQGFESCSWFMTDAKNKTIQRHAILKNSNDNILALSVKIPGSATKLSRSGLEGIFNHMVETAVVR